MDRKIKLYKIIIATFLVITLTVSVISCKNNPYAIVEQNIQETADKNNEEKPTETSIEYPESVGFVNDFAGLFTKEEITQMEDFIKDFEKETTVEIAVVTVKSLEGLLIEKYAFDLFNTWGIGKAGKNNGILLLVALDEKLLRIEVGLGLEEVITNEIAGNIINEVISPYMRENNIGNGCYEGIKAIAEKISSN